MDPLTGLISIVALLGQWKSHQDSHDSKDFAKFVDWLRTQEHQELADSIDGNTELSKALRVLVEDQHGEVMAKLGELSKTVADVASHFSAFQPLANALRLKSGLSDQAVSMLRQLNEAGASRFLEIPPKRTLAFLDINGTLQIDEPRFADDDLQKLCELGLLLLSHNDSGNRIFAITRAGAAVGG